MVGLSFDELQSFETKYKSLDMHSQFVANVLLTIETEQFVKKKQEAAIL
jgi:hypothetical protein